jgi:hypothetical protein
LDARGVCGIRWTGENKGMGQKIHDPWDTILAGSRENNTVVTLRAYSSMVKAKDRSGIAKLIRLRFSERYLDPVLDSRKPHGFAILAIWCLMVESLESFRNGWKGTQGVPGGGEAVFRSLFDFYDEFKDLRPVVGEFYTHVRCGILHQAETTGCWVVNRSSELFSASGPLRRVSASQFAKCLSDVLNRYTDELARTDWKDSNWKNVRKKFRSVCHNCGLSLDDVKKLQ